VVSRPARGLVDTSVLIATDTGRPLDTDRLPAEMLVSVVTIAELHVGVHLTSDIETRTRRIYAIADLGDVEVLDIDEDVSLQWARLRALLGPAARRTNVNDVWIAATAVRYDIPVVTQDADFDAMEGLAGLGVVRV
jgi:predicted nucleic acid-binding protein